MSPTTYDLERAEEQKRAAQQKRDDRLTLAVFTIVSIIALVILFRGG